MRLHPWRWLALAAMLIVGAPAGLQLLLAWPLAPPVVEGARIVAPGEPDGSREAAPEATPRRIEVRFTTDRDLERVRKRRGFAIVSAVLSACDAREWRSEELVTQGPEYLSDEGRVRKLGSDAAGGRALYKAVFDDRLTRLVQATSYDEPAIGHTGGLCLSLRGGSMVFAASSKAVRLPELR